MSNIDEENSKLLNALPEWEDTKTRRKESAEITDYMKNKGYTAAQINNVSASDVVTVRQAVRMGKLEGRLQSRQEFAKECDNGTPEGRMAALICGAD